MSGDGTATWLDGGLLPAGAAAVPATDLGLRTGLGVFETMRATDGRVLALDAHLERLVAGGVRLDLAIDPAHVRRGLVAVLAGAAPEVVVRVTVTGGDAVPAWPPRPTGRPRTLVTRHPAPPLPTPAAAAVVVPGPRAPAGLGDVKTTSYAGSVLALGRARAQGAEVALFEEDGALVCAADGNLMAVRDGVLTTPALDGRVLPGVTRRRVLDLAPTLGLAVREARLDRDDLMAADLVVVTSAVRRVRPLGRLDGAPLRAGAAGADPAGHPLVGRLLAALAAATAASAPVEA